METQPVNLNQSWSRRHPFAVIGIILLVCLGPFVNKAVHADDPLFIWAGQWIQKHPADFFGAEVNWWGTATPMWLANCNPPLMSYFLAAVASVFGWNEIVLHLAGLALAFAAAAGIYSLAKMWCARPLLAAVVAILTPVFLVSSSTLMCDMLMLTFWIWALVFWERAQGNGQNVWLFLGAGVLAGLAVLTKYSAVTLLPLLPVISILRTRKSGWWLAGAAVPLIMVAAYEWITAGMYGKGLLSAAASFAQAHHSVFLGGWTAKGIIGLAFAGGTLLPLLFFAPLLWRRQTGLTGGIVIFGALLGFFWLGDDPGLFNSETNPGSLNCWSFRLQVIFLTAGGLHCLLLAGAETWRRRDATGVILALWIFSGLFFAMMLNWTVSARSFLPVVPAAAILLVRRLETRWGNFPVSGRLLWPLAPAAVVTLGLLLADYQLANSGRTAAEQLVARYKPANHKLWFEQHGGFQYYMEKLGAQPLDCERSVLQPGDMVIVPRINFGFISFPPGSVGWIDPLILQPRTWINLARDTKTSAAGFYSATWGPVPFALGSLPPQEFFQLKVFSGMQFNTQPANPRELLPGDMPVFADFTAACDDQPAPPVNPQAEKQIQLAIQFQADGNIESAIQCCRKALDVDPNNPVVLNNLAWMLATAGKPGLRDGREAVRLAALAVKLTDSRQPLIIGTLGAAYAEAGQFDKAIQAATTAQILAKLTGQHDLDAQNFVLLRQYSAGRAVEATDGP
jgi:4-amino-4-deoxy-L-arabinose transferase-like glycosyltransferase/tetratricopeptide (TPR) repeat protein